jgi:hypothetical protein
VIAAPPDTQLCAEAAELVQAASPDFLFGHCLRSWHFATVLAERHGVAHDAEVLYLGTIMHDLGLVDGLHGPVRFEVAGANQARDELLARGLDPARADVVWDLIALHTSVGIAEHAGPEVALAHMGISVDVVGRWAEEIPAQDVDAILALAPRARFEEAFLPLVAEHVAAHPHVSLFNWMDDVGRVHCPGHTAPRFTELFAANPLGGR